MIRSLILENRSGKFRGAGNDSRRVYFCVTVCLAGRRQKRLLVEVFLASNGIVRPFRRFRSCSYANGRLGVRHQ